MLVQSQAARGPTPKLAAQLIGPLRELGCTVFTRGWGSADENEGLVSKVFGRTFEVFSTYRALRGHAADIVVVHTAHDWKTLLRDIPLAAVVRRRSRPVVLQMHGSQPDRLTQRGDHAFKLATRLLVRAVDGIFVLSREEQREWSAFTDRIPVSVVRNPYARASPLAPSRDDRAAADTPSVLFVGRLLKEKGIFDLLAALPLVRRRTPCRLVVVGDGECAVDLRERVGTLGLGDAVTMTGHLDQDLLRQEYADADAFALPTRWPEGFPTVLAEAMDAGLAIVTTPIRGAADYLVQGEHALFVDPGDVTGLAEALVTLLEDGPLRERMGEANRQRLSLFEPSVVAAGYLQALEAVVHDRHRALTRVDG
jgi:glycosyltransferase involved in cell wall biosynthesis